MYKLSTYLFACVLLFTSNQDVFGYINPEEDDNSPGNQINYRDDCSPATAETELDINNVRAWLTNGGDLWYDGNRGHYIVPNVESGSGLPEVSSIFAGAVWLGGFDPGRNLKLAAVDYRDASNNDFYPGPLSEEGTTNDTVCENWDQIFEVQGSDIDSLIRLYESGEPYTIDQVPDGVKYYPAKGNDHFTDPSVEDRDFELPDARQGLGAFRDRNGNGEYDPLQGEYPVIEIRGCPEELYPDQMMYWIYNDNGGPHTNTLGSPIRMEVQVQAFSFQSNDEINNMSFYRFKLINRALQSIDSTFFAMWTDPDLGCTTDDYIGSDTSRSLMYTYNQDATDGQPGCTCSASGDPTYCNEVPILGIDYFRGPLGPKVYNQDSQLVNPSIGQPEDTVIELGMSSFQYYNNPSIGSPPDPTTDPETAREFYNYMSGSWKDGTPVSFGGNGYSVGAPPSARIPYVFTDAPNNQSGWSMCTADLPQADRRTIQASGPFRLDPGDVNELIIGVVWEPNIDYPCPSLTRLLEADEKAQALFDNCFDRLEGPDPPDIEVIELDQEFVFALSNDTTKSNNKFLKYREAGLEIPSTQADSFYRFQGYQIYQLANQEVAGEPGLDDLNDPSQARIIYQVDLKDTVDEQIFNWESRPDPNSERNLYVPVEQVENSNEGIRHTFSVTEDQFSEDDNRNLVNHKEYYFAVIAYAYNNYKSFDYQQGVGQETPYLAGDVNSYTAVPHPIVYQELNTQYGGGATVTRLDGIGNGGNFLDLVEGTDEKILEMGTVDTLKYKENRTPIEINTYNPLDVVPGEYLIEFIDDDLTDDRLGEETRWEITRLSNDSTYISDMPINQINEQILGEWGFSVTIHQVPDAGVNPVDNPDNGFVGSEITYSDGDADEWYSFIPDGQNPFDYIQNEGDNDFAREKDPDGAFADPENIMYPFILTEGTENQPLITPGWNSSQKMTIENRTSLAELNNVDIVLTPDKSKWSRCVVLETMSSDYVNAGGNSIGEAENFRLRQSPSVSKEADTSGLPRPDGTGTGMAWFPGYAVNVETGERVNIFFGENSFYRPDEDNFLVSEVPDSLLTGGDMMWNPHSTLFYQTGFGGSGASQIINFIAGGQHTIYVTDQKYDGCSSIKDSLTETGPPIVVEEFRKKAYLTIKWTNLSMLTDDVALNSYAEGLIPQETRIKMRVNNPYSTYEATGINNGHNTYLVDISDSIASRDLTREEEVNDALNQVRVVPNPYYAYSSYEDNTTDNTIKITNLPPESTVTIYSLDGKFIRQYERNLARQPIPGNNPAAKLDQVVPDLEWDLRNSNGIPVASGVYLIHIQSPGFGERVLKWFGIQRAFDASQF